MTPRLVRITVYSTLMHRAVAATRRDTMQSITHADAMKALFLLSKNNPEHAELAKQVGALLSDYANLCESLRAVAQSPAAEQAQYNLSVYSAQLDRLAS